MIKFNSWDKSEQSQSQNLRPKWKVSVSNFDTINQKCRSQSQKRNIGLTHTYFFQRFIIDLQPHEFIISFIFNLRTQIRRFLIYDYSYTFLWIIQSAKPQTHHYTNLKNIFQCTIYECECRDPEHQLFFAQILIN